MVDTGNKDTVDTASISFHPCPLVVELAFYHYLQVKEQTRLKRVLVPGLDMFG
jgi:hypothetical protein